MDLDADTVPDIVELARAAGPKSIQRAVAQVRAAYGVPETRAYAVLVRAAALGPVEATATEVPAPTAAAFVPQQATPLLGA